MGEFKKNTFQNPKAEAVRLFEEGAQAWKKGERAAAITLYGRSASLDPEGPGAEALKMSRDIMNFYDTNQLNP